MADQINSFFSLGNPALVQHGDFDYLIRRLRGPDIANGYLQSLEGLAPVGLDQAAARRAFLEMLSDGCHVFVAVAGDQVVGAITLLIEQKMIHRGGKAGRIEDVSVHADCQRRGIGKSLVLYAVEQARRAGCYKVVLECDDTNIQFYQKCGFNRCDNGMRCDLV